MFNQIYITTNILQDPVEILEKNTAYYLREAPTDTLKVVGSNGEYEIVPGEQVIYNPLIDAKIQNYDKDIYKIENLLKEGETISKIQAELCEVESEASSALSKNAIFINANKIHGYKQFTSENFNIYSFETLDDVSTKIRYLGVITPGELNGNEYILLNYYTED